MASGQIKRSEIAESDLYKEIRDSAQKTIQQLDLLNKELRESAQIIKSELATGLEKTTASINKYTQASKKAETTMKTSIKVDQEKARLMKEQAKAEQELEKINQQKERTKQQQLRTAQQQNRESERQAKLAAKNAKAAKDESDAYKQLVRATRDQKNESKRLGAEMLKLEQSGRKNTKEYRNLEQQYRKVTTAARNGDRQLKKLDKTVGDNFRNVGNYRSALGKLSGALSSLGLAFGSAMVIRNVFNVVKDFDQAQANLASVLGVSRNEMSELTETAKQLGATTRFTAAQVSELQLEFAKLGFSQKEINNVTDATLQLAAASGTDLSEAAAVVGANVRAFGLSTLETQRVVDVMAKSFTSSSLDMEKFSTALAIVAPVAKSAGRNIEETTAMIGTLTDRGIDASTAGTGLRNIFLELAKSGMTFDEAMNQINTATDKNATSLELFGKRGAVIGTILAESGDSVAALTEKLNDAGGAAQKMADEQLNTLGGALDLLNSAWQGFILGTDESIGASQGLADVIRFLADNFNQIMAMIPRLVGYYILYRNQARLAAAAQFLFNGGLTKMLRGIPAMIKGLKTASISFRGLGTAMKSIPLVGVISLLTEMVFWLGSTEDATDNLTDAESELNDQLERGNELRAERMKSQKTIDEQFAIRNNLSQAQLKNLKNEIESEIELSEIADAKIKTTKRGVEEIEKERDAIRDRIKAIQEEQKATDKFSIDFQSQMRKNQEELKDFALPDEFLKSQEQLNKESELRELLNKEIALENELKGEGINISDDESANLELRKKQLAEIIPLIKNETRSSEKGNKVKKETVNKLKSIAVTYKEIDDILNGDEGDAGASLADRLQTQTEALDRELKKRITLIKQSLLSGEISDEDSQLKILETELFYLNLRKQLRLDYGEDVTEINSQIVDKELEISNKLLEKTKETQNETVEIVRISADEQIKIIQELTTAFSRLADERIAKLDEEMDKAQQRYDLYLELAKNGNINAQQSLATEARLIAESNRKKEQLERRKQRVQLASDTLQAYLKNSEDPDVKNPLLKTFSDITLLTQFIQNLPAFAKGTEDTGTHGEGVDGKGGFHAILHPNERVLTKKQNEMVGDLSNDELSNLALKYRAGELENKINFQQSKQPQPNEVVERLKSLEQTIRMKPETNIELERIIDGALTITKSVKKGNTVVYNRYRTNR